ncbi:putative endonuclease [Frankia sp. AiPs1]|uniref:YraN family protein n=1 Tax=Frankia sp. AiPa1 TaxID=573492 RepID=UPI00202B11EC|nr:YraN family protein [Frankia sp. AiPa1]MCL9762583.1 YraN family protein [Frankia sp. AiPa1]
MQARDEPQATNGPRAQGGPLTKDELGRFGEEAACRHLAAGGAAILDRNWRCRDGELDIVVRDGSVLVFCEVKTRSGPRYGSGAESVIGRKAARIRRLAARWLAEHPHPSSAVRFDVVVVSRPLRGPVSVEHLQGAF